MAEGGAYGDHHTGRPHVSASQTGRCCETGWEEGAQRSRNGGTPVGGWCLAQEGGANQDIGGFGGPVPRCVHLLALTK